MASPREATRQRYAALARWTNPDIVLHIIAHKAIRYNTSCVQNAEVGLVFALESAFWHGKTKGTTGKTGGSL
jgi:hypothetical protein